MPFVTVSTLTTVGLSLLTGGLKYLKDSNDLPKAFFETLDGLFGGMSGNDYYEKFNKYKNGLENLNVASKNADVERCSRHALLQALIIFSEAAKKHIHEVNLTPKELDDCRYFLEKAQEHFKRKIKELTELEDTSAVLQTSPLTQGNQLTLAIAKKDETERIESVRASLASLALHEFTYPEGHDLHKHLKIWLTDGLAGGRHWFVYYIHELHSNLKKDEPQYCRDARRILTQTKLAEISLMSNETLSKLDQLMILASENKALIEQLIDENKGYVPITNIDTADFIRETQSDFFSSETLRLREKRLTDRLHREHQLCLIGDPGVGKTYLAKKIAYDNKDKYDVVWWIDADNAKVEEELIQLARELCKDPDNPDHNLVDQWLNRDKIGPDGVINNLYAALKGRSWLIVFDNAMDSVSGSENEDSSEQRLNQELEAIQAYQSAYLPEITDKGYLLLTSRNEDWGTIKKSIPTERLNTWSSEDVKEYIQTNENSSHETILVEDVNQLDIFEGLPLAVSIAKKYILGSNDEGKYRFVNFHKKWKENEDYFLKYKSKYYEEDLKHESLFVTVGLSYGTIKPNEKQIIDLFSCFGPDDLPVKLIYNERLKDNLRLDWTTARSSLIQLRKHSLSRFYETENLFSMHRIVQGCIKSLQGDALPNNYKLALFLAADAFKAIIDEKTVPEESKKQNNQDRNLLIPHIDALAITLRDSNINLIRAMNENDQERIKAIEFFTSVGQSQSNIGDIRSATEQFETAIKAAETPTKEVENQKKIDTLKAVAQRGLAKVLFLKGQGAEGIDRAEELAKEAASHFKQENQLDYIDCLNEVVGKIQQRKCLFEDCEATYLKLEEAVNKYIAENTTEETVFEHIVQKYVKGEPDKIAEKRGSIWHNLGSLYWTWGRENKKDYEKARDYFKKAIDFQSQMVTALEGAKRKYTNQGTVLDRLSKADNKILFLNVSRMIYGAVLALLKEFEGEEGEWEQHNEALDFFKERTFEKRRYAYTAYYMLANSWDRKELGLGLPTDFKEAELLVDVRAHDKTLAGNDEKYDLIKKIVNLREGVQLETRKELSELTPDYEILKKYYKELERQLEAMKYIYERDGNFIVRYYDVDTCSVSAILDYAKFLSKKGEIRTAKKIAKYGLDVIKDIEYPRIDELKELAKGNQ